MCISTIYSIKIQSINQCLIYSDEIVDDRNVNYSQAIDNAAAKDPQIIMVVMKTQNEEK